MPLMLAWYFQKYEGRLRQNVLEKGQWRDTLLYALLESDPR